MNPHAMKTIHSKPIHTGMRTIGICALAVGMAFSQPAAPIDYEERTRSVETLKQYIAQREARFESQKQDLLALDARVEKQIDDIVTRLASLKDSNDSRTRVANAKEDVIQALTRTIWAYRHKRVDVFERMRKDSSVPLDRLEKDMKTFDDRIAKRVAQVMTLAKSSPGHQDLEKYESYGGSYYHGYYHEDVRVSEDWKQNRRDTTSGKVMRRDVLQELDKALERNQSRQRSITDALANRKLSDKERALQEQELGRIHATIDNLKANRRELALPGESEGHAIGSDEAHDAEQMLNDARRDLARDFSDIMRKYSELDTERTRLFDMKKNLADREEWLKNNPPPAG
jgi:hypothetical protein